MTGSTDGPESSRKAVNLTVVACIGAHYFGKPVFLCENSAFNRKVTCGKTATDWVPFAGQAATRSPLIA